MNLNHGNPQPLACGFFRIMLAPPFTP
jgi:hypothetical protein